VMDLLVYLAVHAGEVVSREQLLDDVWGNTEVVEHVLTRAISELRRILADDAEEPRYIETIRKRGYRLVAPVETACPKEAVAAEEGPPPESSSATIPLARSRPRARWLLWLAPAAVALMVALALAGRFLHERSGEQDPVVLQAAPFTSYVGNETHPAFSPDGTRVAFSWTGGNNDNADIYVKQRDTDTPLRLTQDPGFDSHAAWSPDGGAIAFARLGKNEAAIFTVPSIGGVERKLYTASSWIEGMDWSLDGKTLLFSEADGPDASHRLRVLSLATLEVEDLTDPPANFNDVSPAISPDGRSVAFIRVGLAGTQAIHVVPLEGGDVRQVSPVMILAGGLVWRADGDEIIFTSAPAGQASLWSLEISKGRATPLIVRDEWVGDPTCPRTAPGLVYETWHCQSNVWEVDLEAGGGPREASAPVIQSTRWDGHARVSSDGRRIAFVSSRSGAAELWACNRDGSATVRLTSLQGQAITAPCWSPSNDRVAFSASPQGFLAVHVIDVDGGPPVRVTSGDHNDKVCAWSPDGTRIYFASDRSGDWEIWSVDPAGENPVRHTREGAIEGFLSNDGADLFYIKPRGEGVWRLPLAGGPEELIYDRLSLANRTNWTIHEGRIFYFSREEGERVLVCHDCGRGETRKIVHVRGLGGPGISVTRDGKTLLYARTDDAATDLKIVEGFR